LMIQCAIALESCLNKIHLPESADFDDPETGFSEARANAERTRAEADAEEAKASLVDLTDTF